ncbi:MAG: MXAN_5187 C-terminal domain-containing protein [Terriglobia bacterium]
MTVDEELEQLADNLRRLKIEYGTYFSGGMPRPPRVLVFRVEKTINKYSGGITEMTYRQRYRFSQLAQSYFAHKNLWRRKQKTKEEGAPEERHSEPLNAETGKPFSISLSDPDAESLKAGQLREAIARARTQAGEPGGNVDPESFALFIREKTRQIKRSLECDTVEFTVSVEAGKVKLRAVKAVTRDK